MQWFKHFSNMRHDAKIRRVISRYGLEGYGLYCLVIESITESLTSNDPIPELEETCEDIADFYNGDTARINEMMSFMVNQGLFQPDEFTGNIVCHNIYKILDTSMTNSPELRKMLKNYRQEMSGDVSKCQDRIEKNRIDKNRKEENKKEDSSLSDFQKHIELWNSLMLPQYRGTGLNIPNITALKAYSFNEIQSAIKNYNSILHSSKYDAFPVYTGFAGFIEKGIEKYADDAFPFERCLTEEEKRRQKENARASPPNTYEEISDPRENNQLSPEETAELLGKFK